MASSDSGANQNNSHTSRELLGRGAEIVKIFSAFEPIFRVAGATCIQEQADMHVYLSIDFFFKRNCTSLLDLIDQLFGGQLIVLVPVDAQVCWV